MDAQPRTIAVIATLDSKLRPAQYVHESLRNLGYSSLLIDTSLSTCSLAANIESISCLKALQIAPNEFEQLSLDNALDIVAESCKEILKNIAYSEGLSAVICIGGGRGSAIGSLAMRALPYWVPKVLVTSTRPEMFGRLVGESNLVVIPTVVDIMGWNSILERALMQSVQVVDGLASRQVEPSTNSTVIAISSFGITTPCVEQCLTLLEAEGFEVLVFPATGHGGRAMEQYILDGSVHGVIDITTSELADHLLGGVASAGPERLRAAASLRVPQVIVPGAMDVVNFGPYPTVPDRYSHRTLIRHSGETTLMRTTVEENSRLGACLAERLAESDGPVTLVVPQGGFSAYDAPRSPFHSPQAITALSTAVRHGLADSGVEYIESELHINDREFGRILVASLLKHMRGGAHELDK